MTKICEKCKVERPLDMFPNLTKMNSYFTSGPNTRTHANRCKPCKAEDAREWRKTHKNYKGTGAIKNIPLEDRLLVSAISQRLSQAKARAAKFDGVEPNIDRNYLLQLFKEQGGRCALSGVAMKVKKGSAVCLSLDKIKPEEGYVIGNVQWVAWAVNRAKGDMSEAVFVDMCRQICEYQKVQRLSKGSES